MSRARRLRGVTEVCHHNSRDRVFFRVSHLALVAMDATDVAVSDAVHCCHGEWCKPRASPIGRMGVMVNVMSRRPVSTKKVGLGKQVVLCLLYFFPELIVLIHGVFVDGTRVDGWSRRKRKREGEKQQNDIISSDVCVSNKQLSPNTYNQKKQNSQTRKSKLKTDHDSKKAQ